MTDNERKKRYTLRILSAYCFSTATMVTCRRLSVRLYANGLSCFKAMLAYWSRDISGEIVTSLRTGLLTNRGSINDRDKTFSLLQSIKPGSTVHPASYFKVPVILPEGVKPLDAWS